MKNHILLSACLFLVIFINPPEGLKAQVRVGLNPPNMSWSQINHENYQVIFPQNRQNDAFRVADLLERILQNDSLKLPYPDVKIPVILQNRTVLPNGFVSIGPWRSEYNLTPPQFQFAGIVPWLDLLTVHEYRHVQQVSNARRGFAGKGLRLLFGQGGWAFYNRGVMPRWFLEGDAVYAETMYTKGGRGRSPDFERPYRALRLAGLDYNYEKASVESFKDFVPSHYHLGYYMTTYARRTHGAKLWDEVISETYSKPGLYRFSKAVRDVAGSGTKQLYYSTMADLDRWWGQQDKKIEPVDSDRKSPGPHKVFTNYRYPLYQGEDQLIVQKSSLNQIRTLYQLENGKERKLFVPGISLNEHYSIGGNLLAWSEVRFHPRWTGETYSVIRIYDLANNTHKKISSKSKLFAPGVSPDGKSITAVESSVEGTVSLVIMRASDGFVTERVPALNGEVFSFPRWSDDGRSIIVAGRNQAGNFLKSYDIPTQTWKELMSLTSATIDRIYPQGKYIFYSSSMNGVQNIFALDTTTSENFQITNSKLGAYDPAISPDGKKVAFSEYTAMGFVTRELVLTDALWKQTNNLEIVGSNYFQPLEPVEVGDITQDTPDGAYEVVPFRYFTKGLFNVHSWYPYVTTEEFGFGALSKNIMSTLVLNGRFTYNTNENSWKTQVQSSYGAFFPIIDLDVSTGQRETNNLLSVSDSVRLYRGNWTEHAFAGGIRLPLNITHGSYPSAISLSSKYRHYLVNYLDGITDNARDENFGSLDLDFGFTRQQSLAHQNINPRWAQTVSLNYQKTLGNSENQGEILTINSALFFPGVFKNHSLFITGGYQQEDIVNAYRFEDIFTNARGYSSFPFESIYRVSANYTLPFWYPDLALGSLMFFKRLRGNFFYDYSEGTLFDLSTQLRSYGLEAVVDFTLVRLVEVAAGVRLGRTIDDDDYLAEFFISSIRF